MLPASNRGAGECLGFPDVCLTPAAPAPIPVPYPNIGMNVMAAPFSPSVMLSMVPALNQGSMIPVTMGDEAGSASPIKGPARYTMGNPVVKVSGLPGINLTCPTTGNNMNDPLGAVLVPSVTNVFFTSTVVGAPALGPIGAAELVHFAHSLESVAGDRHASDDAIVGVRPAVFTFALATEIGNALLDARPAGIVLDLRGHPGGDLDAAAALAADFLPEGAVVYQRVDADGDVHEVRAPSDAIHAAPLAVLVDRFTASAAEVVAGALAAHGRAAVVGERTLGKGTAQKIVTPFGALSSVYATVARIELPGGVALDGVGVEPTVAIAPGAPLSASALAALADAIPTGSAASREALARAVARAW